MPGDMIWCYYAHSREDMREEASTHHFSCLLVISKTTNLEQRGNMRGNTLAQVDDKIGERKVTLTRGREKGTIGDNAAHCSCMRYCFVI